MLPPYTTSSEKILMLQFGFRFYFKKVCTYYVLRILLEFRGGLIYQFSEVKKCFLPVALQLLELSTYVSTFSASFPITHKVEKCAT